MRNRHSIAALATLAFAFMLLTGIVALAQNATNTRPVHVPQGEKRKIQGVVSTSQRRCFQSPRSCGQRNHGSADRQAQTLRRTGFARRNYPVTYIMRGLRLQAQGRGDADGNLVADWVRFDEQDLRSAQALEQTDELAKENNARVAAAEEAARQAEETARIMRAQIAENTALANDARAKAEAAQRTADQAFKDAALANNRINGLDDYETIRTISILFKSKQQHHRRRLPERPSMKRRPGLKKRRPRGTRMVGSVEVVGFADRTGNTAKNRALSERRSKSVIQYLVGVHSLDLRRLVQPLDMVSPDPLPDNKTAAGRAKNRRVEIRDFAEQGNQHESFVTLSRFARVAKSSIWRARLAEGRWKSFSDGLHLWIAAVNFQPRLTLC